MGKHPYRVLQVVTIMNRGGIESMIMNLYRAIDRNKIQFDFLVHRNEKGDFDDEIESLGGKIFKIEAIRPWNYYQYFKSLDKFFQINRDYQAVHSHIQENSGFALKYAAKYSIPIRIAHSHSTLTRIDYKYPFRIFAKFYLNKYATAKFSCGKEAGDSLFGENANYRLFNNSIDSSRFQYNPSVRSQVRKELNIDNNTFVIGNVARLNRYKNQTFAIDVFAKLIATQPNAILIFVGVGETEASLKQKVQNLRLEKNILFLGLRKDVNRLLQAFDVLLFPSIFEGLPVSLIEAQAAGLPCVLSDTIDSQTAITPNVKFISLSATIQAWVDLLLSFQNFERQDTSEYIMTANYDIHRNAEWLTDFYLKNTNFLQ